MGGITHGASASRIRTPWWPLAATIVAGSASIALAALNLFGLEPDSILLLATGYALGAIVATVFVSVHRGSRNARRGHPQFLPQPGLDRLAAVGLSISMAAGLANAVLLALELSKQ
jgi:hypothetical protein